MFGIKKRQLEENIRHDILPITVHELRTPLGGMRWSLEMLMSGDAGPLPDVAQDLVNQIHENNQRLISLVNNLLEIWRMSQKELIHAEPIDVPMALDSIVRGVVLEAAVKHVSVKSLAIGKTIPKIKADPRIFEMIMDNLVSNAIVYSFENGAVSVDADAAAGFVTIHVVDNGIGIPDADQTRIFSQFFRARNAIKGETPGTGLGLFIARSYAEILGGSMWFESKENKGSAFHIKLPALS